ncbi:hypothetical protein A1F97_10500, partial [Pyrenophora tritici-repentis]
VPTQELLAIGEHKAPGIIDSEWSPAGQTTKSRNLSRELRGYAYHYKCPQVFCYDGVRMLIVRLRANDREDIKRCNGDMFVIPIIAGPGGIPIRYALYRLMVDGLHRIMAATAPPVMILPYTRRFYWFSGECYWVDGSNTKYSSVPGVVRMPIQQQTGKWQWAWMNQSVFAGWCSDFF